MASAAMGRRRHVRDRRPGQLYDTGLPLDHQSQASAWLLDRTRRLREFAEQLADTGHVHDLVEIDDGPTLIPGSDYTVGDRYTPLGMVTGDPVVVPSDPLTDASQWTVHAARFNYASQHLMQRMSEMLDALMPGLAAVAEELDREFARSVGLFQQRVGSWTLPEYFEPESEPEEVDDSPRGRMRRALERRRSAGQNRARQLGHDRADRRRR